jgi:predicted enzyme related to lactoylglutathione lyase
MKAKYVHTNIIARDWQELSSFYQFVFGLVPTGPRRDIKGGWADRLTGIQGVHIVGEHLHMPGYEERLPTLEIFTYKKVDEMEKPLTRAGFGHIAFEVDDVAETAARVEKAGGYRLGEIVSIDYGELGKAAFAYVRDIEGNIIELQSWQD